MKSAVKIWRERKERYENLGKEGKVVSWTKIIEAPVGWQGQYYGVIVELDNKLKVMGQMVNCQRIGVGDKVTGVLRRLGEAREDEVIEYGVKWKKQ